MKSSKHIKTLIGFVGVIISFITIGCTVYVPLTKYNPVFTGDYSTYKGKRVFLMNFDNKAIDTTVRYYFSPYIRTFYHANDWVWIHNYFWYAFRDAFTKLGMLVSDDDNPDLTAPAMCVTLVSITDENYDVRVTVQRKGTNVFTKAYTILEPRLEKKDRNPAVLEERAYKMTNKLISTILEDPAFQKHLAEP